MAPRTLFFLLFAVLGACKSDPVRPPHEGDRESGPGGAGGGATGPVVADSGTTPTADGGTCNDLAVTGDLVDENAIAGDFAGTGGAILDGTYNLIEAQLYLGGSSTATPGPTNRSYKGTIHIAGTAYESVLVTQTGGANGAEVRSSGTLTNDGTTATLTLTCPAASQERLNYAVTGTGLTLSNAVSRVTFVFAKAP
jgi:hypothetical protein